MTYFKVQAKLGITKHPGGLHTTKQLIKDCNINKDTELLEVGCGSGINTRYIRKHTKADITAIDIRKDMVKTAKEKTKDRHITYAVADAHDLPFPDNSFDVVISESVTAFMLHKLKALKEYRRVLKPGGYLGIVEGTWLHTRTPEDIVEYCHDVMGGCKPETAIGWVRLLLKAGFKVTKTESGRLSWWRQGLGEVRMNGLDGIKALGRLAMFYTTDEQFRKDVHKLIKVSKKVPKGMIQHFGYGIYVARKKSKKK